MKSGRNATDDYSGPLQCDRLARPACFRQCLGRARTLNPKEITQ
jgi:hypothetical protein